MDTREQRAEDAESDESGSVSVRQVRLKAAGGRIVGSQARSATEDQSDRSGDRRIIQDKPEVRAVSDQAEIRNKLVRYQETITGIREHEQGKDHMAMGQLLQPV
ncbi:unnamed protein product [Staurois parvus]|uniref:Uncharacterized protein n=1 Tax=Staurois parvus TaxID=386267 RepID=A0ABN9FNE6_9NEOB|nr:unnamed protein product [Staurois parvus]